MDATTAAAVSRVASAYAVPAPCNEVTSERLPGEDYNPYFGKHLKQEDLFSFWCTAHTNRGRHPALGDQLAQTDGSMPRFCFDTSDGNSFSKDGEGIVLDRVKVARQQAQSGLADTARDVVPGDGLERIMTVVVRNEAGKTGLKSSLILKIEL